jgi:hypothetical protein
MVKFKLSVSDDSDFFHEYSKLRKMRLFGQPNSPLFTIVLRAEHAELGPEFKFDHIYQLYDFGQLSSETQFSQL